MQCSAAGQSLRIHARSAVGEFWMPDGSPERILPGQLSARANWLHRDMTGHQVSRCENAMDVKVTPT